MIRFKTLRPTRLSDKSLKFLAWFFSLQSLPGQNSCFVSSSSNVTKHFYLTTGSLNSLKEKMLKKVEDAYNSWVFFFLLIKLKFINESGRALWQATFKIFQAIRVFLLMRDLCLALLGQSEKSLPLSKIENSVNLEDVLDLSEWKFDVPFVSSIAGFLVFC